MELSISTNVIFERKNGYDTDIERTIKLCSKAGYKILDFCFHDLTRFDSPIFTENWKNYFKSLRKLADELDIKFKQGHSVVYDFCNPNIDHKLYKDLTEKCIIGAEILGVEWLVVHPSTDFSVPDYIHKSKLNNIDYFKKLVSFASKHNVKIAVENMWDLHIAPKRLYCTSIEELIDLVDSVNGLGICFDVEHAAIMEMNQIECMKLIGNRLKVLHVSDYLNVKDIHLLPYMGKSNWKEIMEGLRIVNYDGLFNFEIHRFLVHIPEDLYLLSLKYSFEIGKKLLHINEEMKQNE